MRSTARRNNRNVIATCYLCFWFVADILFVVTERHPVILWEVLPTLPSNDSFLGGFEATTGPDDGPEFRVFLVP